MRPVSNALASALRDDDYRSARVAYRDLFSDGVFLRPQALTQHERCRLAYQRLRQVNDQLSEVVGIIGDPARLHALYEWCALADPVMAAIALCHYDLGLGTVLDLGGGNVASATSAVPDELGAVRQELVSLSSFGTIVAAEQGHGRGDFLGIETEARYDSSRDEFVLHTPSAQARKRMANTGLAGMAKTGVVLARFRADGRDHGVRPFAVRLRDASAPYPGVSITSLPEQPGVALDSAEISFDRLRVPAARLLAGGTTASEIIKEGPSDPRACLASSMARAPMAQLGLVTMTLSWARASLAIAVGYSRRRMIAAGGSGPVPLIRVPDQRDALLGGLASVYSLTCWVTSLRSRYRRLGSALAAETALAKAICSAAAYATIARCRQRTGAHGMLSTSRIADYLGVCDGTLTGLGDNESTLAGATSQLLPLYSATAACEVERDLRGDEAFLRPLLVAERVLHERAVAEDAAPAAAVAFARVHAARLAAGSLITARRRIDAGTARELLRLLAIRYVLDELSAGAVVLLAENALDPDQLRRIPEQLSGVNEALAPYTRTLVDAFEVPGAVLANLTADDGHPAAREAAPA